VLWQRSRGVKHIKPIHGTLFRLVESQEQVATLGYVDTLEEQALLEQLLESTKPPYVDRDDSCHYLLRTPFRYPPLPWGSRFGRRHEPGICYGGGAVAVTLAESAYYRFIFWYSMTDAPVKPQMRSEHTLFSVGYSSAKGVQLQNPPFATFATALTDPRHYSACQEIGSAMRDAGVQAFEYSSARDLKRGICIGLFSPAALAQRRPQDQTQWLCELSAQEVSFMQVGSRAVDRFPLEQFLVEGELPWPAA
jgi:hypothetical protein